MTEPVQFSLKDLREQGAVGSRYDYVIWDNSRFPRCEIYDWDDDQAVVATLPVECPELAEALAGHLSAEDDRRLGIQS